MQIILSNEEIETIFDALLTSLNSLTEGKKLEVRRGLNTNLIDKYISNTEALIKRIEPYAKNT